MHTDSMDEVPLDIKDNQFTKSQKEEIWEIAHPILSTIKNIFK